MGRRVDKKNARPFRYFLCAAYLNKCPKFGETKSEIYRLGGANDKEVVEISENGNGIVQSETTELNKAQTCAREDPNKDIKKKR